MKVIRSIIFFNILLFNQLCYSQVNITDKILANTTKKVDIDSLLDVLDSIKETIPSIELSNDYSNEVVFWGRLYREKQFGSQSSLMFKSGFGLNIYASQYYWSKMSHPWARTDIGIELEKQFTDNFYAALNYERWVFYNNDIQEGRELKNDFELKLNYDFTYFSIMPVAYYMTGDIDVFQTDLVIKGDYELFMLLKTGRLFLQPEILMSCATSSFLLVSYDNVTPVDFNKSSFKIADYEAMLPLTFNYKNFDFKLACHYVYPVNVLETEKLSPFMYYTFLVSYSGFFNHRNSSK